MQWALAVAAVAVYINLEIWRELEQPDGAVGGGLQVGLVQALSVQPEIDSAGQAADTEAIAACCDRGFLALFEPLYDGPDIIEAVHDDVFGHGFEYDRAPCPTDLRQSQDGGSL